MNALVVTVSVIMTTCRHNLDNPVPWWCTIRADQDF